MNIARSGLRFWQCRTQLKGGTQCTIHRTLGLSVAVRSPSLKKTLTGHYTRTIKGWTADQGVSIMCTSWGVSLALIQNTDNKGDGLLNMYITIYYCSSDWFALGNYFTVFKTNLTLFVFFSKNVQNLNIFSDEEFFIFFYRGIWQLNLYICVCALIIS